MGIAPLLLLLQAWSPAEVPPDSAKALRQLAQRAEWTYEYLLRSMAPVRFGRPPTADYCDEIIGRFCLTFSGRDNARRPDTTVAGKVISARQLAVDMLRRAFSGLPGDIATAGPLLRYLVEDGRAEEAVAAARTFAWASGDSAWGPFLVGYALHADRQDSLAEIHFLKGLRHLDEKERNRVRRVTYLLDPDEQSVYKKLSDAEKERYEEALWRLGDPLYLTPGNERFVEHLARHVWSLMLASAPLVHRMPHWGDDLEQLTVRYGVPTSRERVLGDFLQSESMTEYYDPELLAYLPENLYTRGIPPTPPPGTKWDLDRDRARSGYRPLTIRKLLPLTHQVSRFPAAGSKGVLRIDASIALDDEARHAARAMTGLFILDSAYLPLSEERGTIPIDGDTINFSAEIELAAGRYVYSMELFEDSTRFAGRARYGVEIMEPGPGGLALSDPVVTVPFGSDSLPLSRHDPRLRPRASLIISKNETIGLYAEAHRLAAGPDNTSYFTVSLTVGSAESPSLLARAWGWVGRKLGVAKPAETPKLAWDDSAPAGRPAIIAVDLAMDGLKPGLYAIELKLTDRVSAVEVTTSRLIRIEQ